MLTQVNLRRRRHECCVFDGVNEFINVGDVSAMDFERTDPFSLVCWYRTGAAGFRCFMSKGDEFGGADLGRGWEFSVLAGRLHTRIDSDDVTNGITKESTATGFDDNIWRHVVLTYAGTSLAAGVLMYANAVAVPQNTLSNTLSATIRNGRPFQIGAQDSVAGFFSGHLDEVAVFDKVLSAGEVTSLFNGGLVVDYTTLGISGLVGYWRMAEISTFPTIPDEVGGNHGTMTNMQHFGPTRSRVLRPTDGF